MVKEYILGRWDLSELAPKPSSPMFQKTLDQIEEKTRILEERRELLKADIASKEFYETLHLYEALIEDMSKIGHYGHLRFSSDTRDAEARALLARISDFNAKIANRTLFFDLWWKKDLDPTNYHRLIKDAGHLTYHLQRSRTLARYVLTESEEKIINIKDTTGTTFLRRFYDQYTERFIFSMILDGEEKELTKPELTSFFRHSDPRKRKGAYQSLLDVYRRNEDVLGELYRTIVMDWRNEGVHLRGYESPISIRNISNDLPDQTVKTLLSICRRNRNVFQHYFKQKAKMLGMKKMTRYHIYAPINGSSDHDIPFDTAVRFVLESLKEFSPQISCLAHKVLNANHMDAELRKGKRGGAFCATVAPDITPYILLNYTGKYRDILTLAHELGHAVHSQLAADKSILVQRAPLPLAELASVFSELIVFERMLKTASLEERKRLLMKQLDNLYATIMRQAYFTIFEQQAHEAISNGATSSEISSVYSHNLQDQFSDAIHIAEEFQHEWTYIPHFFHSPFYTYAYAFGNLLTISLYHEYRTEGKKFVSKYIGILSSGGSKSPEELLDEKDFDLRSVRLWQSGFDYVREQVEELGRLAIDTNSNNP